MKALILFAAFAAWTTAQAQLVPERLPLGALIESGARDAVLAQSIAAARSASAVPTLRGYVTALARVVEAERDAPRPRGAAEVRLFENASPAVVLVLNMDRNGERSGIGSGSVISRDGQIVTNWHVIASASQVGVVLKPASEAQDREPVVIPARLIKADPRRDLALIQLTHAPDNLRTLTLGSLGDVKVGADVHAIGHPFGEGWTYTRGVVSQIRRPGSWSVQDSQVKHEALAVIQTQTPINPGNSGGPLLSDDMRIVGVNTYGRLESQGLNYAVSVDDVKRFLAEPAPKPVAKDPGKSALAGVKAGCEPHMGKRQRDEAERAWMTPVDTDCDGRADAVLIEWDPSLRRGRVLAIDTNGDGRHDVIYVDEQNRGRWDYSMHDTDFDGRPDTRAEYDGASLEPVRIVRVK